MHIPDQPIKRWYRWKIKVFAAYDDQSGYIYTTSEANVKTVIEQRYEAQYGGLLEERDIIVRAIKAPSRKWLLAEYDSTMKENWGLVRYGYMLERLLYPPTFGPSNEPPLK